MFVLDPDRVELSGLELRLLNYFECFVWLVAVLDHFAVRGILCEEVFQLAFCF